MKKNPFGHHGKRIWSLHGGWSAMSHDHQVVKKLQKAPLGHMLSLGIATGLRPRKIPQSCDRIPLRVVHRALIS